MFLNEVFKKIAEQNPESPFLFEDGRVFTYGEFRECTGYWVQQLRKKGVGPSDRVGIYARNSIEGVVAIYAVAACGATFVPLSVDDPDHRLALTVKDADLKLVLSGTKLRFPLKSVDAVIVDTQAGRSPSLELCDFFDEHPLYIIYTSGSTGVPKGTQISGGCLGHFCRWACEYLKIQSEDVVLGHARLTFDISLFYLYVPALRGASIQIISKPADLAYPGAAIGEKVSIAMFVPRVTGLMQQAGQLTQGLYPRLRHVIFCGERLHAYQANAWIESVPHVQIHNMYGPTEATVVVTCHSLPKGIPVEDPIPIGHMIAGNSAEFFNDGGQTVAGETLGEMILIGKQISPWDYWQRPTERFFNHPKFGRCFRSGDLVRRNAEGLLFWEGRIDDQIKVRGFRVELMDIEASLADSSVHDLACVYDAASERVLAGFCMRSDRTSKQIEAQLRDRANQHLPAYMRPQGYYLLNELPRTANGKTDRKALLELIRKFPAHEFDSQ